MNKHEQCWQRIAREVSKLSNCPRAQVGAVIVDPATNNPVSVGYNGGPKGVRGSLCSNDGSVCVRNECSIPSGTDHARGCVHAELNATLNAGSTGIGTRGKHLFVTCLPCLGCAKALHHAGIRKVYMERGHYKDLSGFYYLQIMGIEVRLVDAIDMGE